MISGEHLPGYLSLYNFPNEILPSMAVRDEAEIGAS